MAIVNFPASPSTNDTYTENGKTWVFNGTGWQVQSNASTLAPLDSPALTGTPTAPTPAANDNDTSIATTAYVQTELADYLTTSSASSTYATITNLNLKANIASPAFTGNPTAPTPTTGDNDTSIATTQFVQSQLAANTVTSSTDVTTNRLLKNLTGPAQAFRRGNVLGGVAQSGGVPTGALLERGSNGNGIYFKYADGSLICAVVQFGLVSAGNSYTWTYPASFNTDPVIVSNCATRGDSSTAYYLTTFGSGGADGKGTSSTTVRAASDGGNSWRVDIIAIGTWF